MIGELLTSEEHGQLAALGVAAFLEWTSVTSERLWHVSQIVRDGTVCAGSVGVVHALSLSERRRQSRAAAEPVLTGKERAVLRGLRAGWTQQRIAKAEGVSLRTIEERISCLKDKFGVPTTFVLGMMSGPADRDP